MDSKLEIILFQFEQPEEFIWGEILRFAEQWNNKSRQKFLTSIPFELIIYFSGEEDEELKELEKILEQKHRERQWTWVRTIPHHRTKEEIEAHDYIQILGDGYPDKFFLNESKALSREKPCETCGTVHPHLRTQKKQVQVDESYLNRSGTPNNQYVPKGLDLINLPHGALLVSEKVVELIKENEFSGCTFGDVIDQKGAVSGRLFQLKTDLIILIPDNLKEEGAICPACGTVLSTLVSGFSVKKERLGKSDFFSRNPSGLASISISKSLYHLLKSENVRGLTPVRGTDVISDLGL